MASHAAEFAEAESGALHMGAASACLSMPAARPIGWGNARPKQRVGSVERAVKSRSRLSPNTEATGAAEDLE